LKLISIIVISGLFAFLLTGEWLLDAWLKNEEAVSYIYPVLSIMLVGSVFSAFYNIGYIHWLVYEKLGHIFRVNIIAFVLSVFVIPVLITNFGLVGAAFGWVVINLIGFFLSLGWVGKLKSE
jgi:O-antigen/teichoic acid export membrane protein